MSEIVSDVTLVLDKERHLRLTLKGMIEFKKLTGKDLLQGFNLAEYSVEEIAALMWACLIWEDKSLKLEDAQELAGVWNLKEVYTSVVKCLTAAFPDQKERKEEERPLAGSGSPPTG
ncbi:MAG: hypothetical protein PHU08_04435 [Dehalococcoidales bacterium]|nr:hypothetical protein [Dehalococcoidales bacterium]